MKKTRKLIGIIAIVAIIGLLFTGCGEPPSGGGPSGGGGSGGGGGDPALPGTIVITPNSSIYLGAELTAVYTQVEDEEITEWQWKKGSVIVGSNSNKFTPASTGSYTVTVSAEGYKKKTSSEVYVNSLQSPGTVTITPNQNVMVGTKLTASYTPFENEKVNDLSYRWERNGVYANSTNKEFTPTQAGAYTVTIRVNYSAGKTSSPVIVRTPEKRLTQDKWYEILDGIRYAPESFDGTLDLSEYTPSDKNETIGLTPDGELRLYYDTFFSTTYKEAYEMITELILPDAATTTRDSSTFSGEFVSFKNLEKVTGNNITKIGNNNFNGCLKLETIDMPKVETIGEGSFRDTVITSLDFPLLTKIGKNAFIACKSLTEVDFLEVTEIGSGAFSACTSLTKVDLPKVATIGSDIFNDCTSLKEVLLGEITIVDKGLFNILTWDGKFQKGMDNYKKISLPKVKIIGEDTFRGNTGLTSINIPLAETIGLRAFQDCTALVDVEGRSVTTINNYAFYRCSKISSINFEKVTIIGQSAFEYCASLVTVSLPKATELGISAFASCSKISSITLPEMLKFSGYAFSKCTELVSVTLPKIKDIYHNAFEGCIKLETVTLGTNTAPLLGHDSFDEINIKRTIIVKVPSGAADNYGGARSHNEDGYPSFTVNWANGFRGAAWTEYKSFQIPGGYMPSHFINTNITIVIEE